MNIKAYWILDYVVRHPLMLNFLVDEDLVYITNKPDHGLDHGALVSALNELFQKGFLAATRYEFIAEDLAASAMMAHGSDIIEMRKHGSLSHARKIADSIPTIEEIEAALAGDLPLEYKLTALGGGFWEDLTHPKWDHFIQASYGLDPNDGEIISSNIHVVKTYFSFFKLGYVMDRCAVIADSETWDILVPWQPTYWKALDKGYRIRFLYEVERGFEVDINKVIPQEARNWLTEVDEWYTVPAEQP